MVPGIEDLIRSEMAYLVELEDNLSKMDKGSDEWIALSNTISMRRKNVSRCIGEVRDEKLKIIFERDEKINNILDENR